MYSVHDWAEVHRLHRVEGMSKSAIAAKLSMSRTTVIRLLGLSEPPSYERALVGSQVDGFADAIAAMLDQDPKLPATVIARRLRPLGFVGSLTILKDHLRQVRPQFVAGRCYQRTSYLPGELAQVDWWHTGLAVPVGKGQSREAFGLVAGLPASAALRVVFTLALDKLVTVAARIFRLTIEIDEPALTAEEAAARLTHPVIVLSRHAGPGDSFLLVHQLLNRYGRRPRIVMKGALQFDPSLDVMINRLPHAFVWPGHGSGVTAEIRRLAAGLGPTGALVIFPEGGNFTPGRRVRAIQRLERKRRRKEAARARRLDNLLAPRTGGAIAAIEAAPTADVIFVAHTGLDDLVTVRDIWRSLPMEQTLRSKWWRVLAEDVPEGRDKQVDWLYDWWKRIDTWIEENRPVRTSPA